MITDKQRKAIDRYTCPSEYIYTTWDKFETDLLSDHEDIIIWAPFEYFDRYKVLELIEEEL